MIQHVIDTFMLPIESPKRRFGKAEPTFQTHVYVRWQAGEGAMRCALEGAAVRNAM
jgi:hypothetical protein